MSILSKDNTLIDLVKVYKKAIPDTLCKNIISRGEETEWKKHNWHTYQKSNLLRPDQDKELLRKYDIGNLSKLEITPIINEYIQKYINEVSRPYKFNIGGISIINLNKYELGTEMLVHHDHIYSLFNGTVKGIPIFSIVGLLNNDFEGGEFVLWTDEVVKLEAGDILIFPSCFAYPHRVKTITKGTRYSIVCWAH